MYLLTSDVGLIKRQGRQICVVLRFYVSCSVIVWGLALRSVWNVNGIQNNDDIVGLANE